jgi:uncharacterized membrane protein
VFKLTLEQGYSVTTMLAVAAAAVLLTALFYYRAFGTLRRGQWQTLLALRVLTILVVVLLLFKPVFSYHRDLKEQPALVFLLDASSSMSIADDASGATRFDQARQQMEAWWEQLQEDFNLHLIAFSERARPLDEIGQLIGLAPDGKATSLSRALVSAAKKVPRRDVEAVILVSDGIHNAAGKPEDVALKMGLPVHTVGVGASLRSDVSYRDVQVTGLDCPDRLMLDNKARITASIEGIGLAGRVVTAILEDDGTTLAEQEIALDDVEGAQEVEFEIRPTVEGRHTYTVRVPPVGEEKIEENNQRSAVALVVEPGIRVLYLEGTLRAEYGALVQRFLSKDPDLEFCALLQTRPNVFLKRSNIEGLELDAIPSDAETIGTFDVFIFGDLDSSYVRPEQQKLFVQRVRDGAGVVMLGGYHSLGPGGYAGTPLGEILPTLLGDREIGQVTDPFLPTLSPDGAHHPIFANIADFFPTESSEPKVAGLPPLLGCTRVGPARPGATVLATCGIDAEQPPVLAVQPVDKGRTAVFSGDTTRNWQQGPRAMDQDSPFLQFWGQLVRWLAGRTSEVTTEASVVGSTDKGYYDPQEIITISAVVRDQEGEGTDEATVTAKIKGPAGRPDEVEMTVVPGPGGHYSATYEPTTAGAYEIAVEARLGDLTLTSDEMAVEVGRPNLEFEKLDLDEKTLGRIAANTGGRCVHISTADHLIDQLDRTQRKRRVYLERPLFWPPLFWTLFVGLLTTEWILRRRFQLR